MVLGILVQTTFGNDLRVDGAAPDLMLLLAVSAGFVAGPDSGAVIGFAAGLFSDLFLQGTPFGLCALAFCLAGYCTGWGGAYLLRSRLLLAPLLAGAGTVLGVALFVMVGYVVGQQQLVAPGERWLVQVALVEALYSAVLALPVTVLLGYVLQGPSSVAAASLVPAAPTGVVELQARRRPLGARSRRRRRVRARAR